MANRTTNHQSGFGIVALLSVIIAIVIVVGIGFFTYSKHTRTAPASANTAVPTTPAPSKADTTLTAAEPTLTGATLAVKEWSITISLPDSLRDAYYVASNNSADADGSMNTIWLGLKSKDTSTCAAALGNTGGSVMASIFRVLPTEPDPVSGELYTKLYPNGVMLGKYYFGYSPQTNADNKCGAASTRTDFNAAFSQAIKSAKASGTITD